jgi:uncharacterized membrane protein YkvI
VRVTQAPQLLVTLVLLSSSYFQGSDSEQLQGTHVNDYPWTLASVTFRSFLMSVAPFADSQC